MIYDFPRDQKFEFEEGLMIYDFPRDQKFEFKEGLMIYRDDPEGDGRRRGGGQEEIGDIEVMA
jgi:hypothetical protein